MPRKVEFYSADPSQAPHKGGRYWLHRKAGWHVYGGGRRTLREEVRFRPGQVLSVGREVTPWEADWLLARLPQCFREVPRQKPPVTRKADLADPTPDPEPEPQGED